MMFKPRPKGLGKDNFLKIEDGGEVTGVLKGEVHAFRKHWMGGNMPSVECPGKDCPVCATNPPKGAAPRYRVNFITSKDGQWSAKIFEFGNELYDQFFALNKKFDIANIVLDIGRTGKDKNTRYNILARPDIQITKEMRAKIDAVPLLALSAEEAQEGAA